MHQDNVALTQSMRWAMVLEWYWVEEKILILHGIPKVLDKFDN